MSKSFVGLGALVLFLTGAFDWWVWSNLLSASTIGAGIAFGILALFSVGITIVGGVFGLILIFGGD